MLLPLGLPSICIWELVISCLVMYAFEACFSLLSLNKVLSYSPLTGGLYCLQIRTSK